MCMQACFWRSYIEVDSLQKLADEDLIQPALLCKTQASLRDQDAQKPGVQRCWERTCRPRRRGSASAAPEHPKKRAAQVPRAQRPTQCCLCFQRRALAIRAAVAADCAG